MIKLGAQPRVDRVALLALRRKAGGHVIRFGRLLICALMAGVALDRQSLELANRLALVTIGAIQSSVPAYQRKPVVVLLHSLQQDVPTLHCVALLAVGSHLATMNVGVAVGAIHTRIGEYRFGVTLGAGDALVQTAQGIFSLIVIKLRHRSDGLPPHRGMAVLAGDIQVAMRTSRNR